MNDVLNAIKGRRSVRAYKDTKVSKEDINTLVEAGMYGPCGISMKDRRFTAIINEDVVKKVNETLRQTFLHMEVNENTPPIMKQMKENAKKEDANFLYNAPALIIVSVNDDDDFGESNAAVSLENMMIAAISLDLETCWLNQLTRLNDIPSIKSLKKELDIPDDHRIYGTLAVGYGAMTPGEESSAVKKSSLKMFE